MKSRRSSSPARLRGRRQLLELIGLAHLVRPTDVEEVRREDENPTDFALRAARDKALAVAAEAELPVLGSDTVVEIDGAALGKPVDRADAVRMLRLLSGRTHHVHTAVCPGARRWMRGSGGHHGPSASTRCPTQ